ncbi:type IV secretory pathway TraG/TraD family ATPase VirD4 [Nakamurella sp. UYEF19]|uniref:type IV secretory system conjugative DNA transfer family protein n=1 Tax=Nakamurella sp. UYEF19 TaxID=1756392 RepID=UPI0033959630
MAKSFTKEPVLSPKAVLACVVGASLFSFVALMWLGGQVAALLAGHGFASGGFLSGFAGLLKPGRPGWDWTSQVAGPAVYWPVQIVVVSAAAYGVVRVVRWWRARVSEETPEKRTQKLLDREGVATTADLRREVGPMTLVKKAESLRPKLLADARESVGLPRRFDPPLMPQETSAMVRYLLGTGKVQPTDLGWRWGFSRGEGVWTSVRDSVLVCAPSGAGKGVFTVINAILDAPGAVIVTSTRPDALTPTFEARREVGPVAVLSADGAVSGLPNSFRWSVIRGCEDGETAQIRAEVLAADSGKGVENASYWEGKTKETLKTLLHAAALGRRSIHDLWMWTKSPLAAMEAVRILDSMPERAEMGWAQILREKLEGNHTKLENEWGGVVSALEGLDIAAVRERFNPGPGEEFDVKAFLYAKGTLYLLADEGHPASKLLSALIADVVRVARREADGSLKSRLDPPLTLVLDEIANFSPLPKLPEYLSAYGGSGIITRAYLQSLAQGRDKWGDQRAASMLGSATVKVFLRGGAVASDLKDLETLVGVRDEETWSQSRSDSGGGGSSFSVSSSVRSVPVLLASEIVQLPEGVALMMVGSAAPIIVTMEPYYQRKDYLGEWRASQDFWEDKIIEAAKERADVRSPR